MGKMKKLKCTYFWCNTLASWYPNRRHILFVLFKIVFHDLDHHTFGALEYMVWYRTIFIKIISIFSLPWFEHISDIDIIWKTPYISMGPAYVTTWFTFEFRIVQLETWEELAICYEVFLSLLPSPLLLSL